VGWRWGGGGPEKGSPQASLISEGMRTKVCVTSGGLGLRVFGVVACIFERKRGGGASLPLSPAHPCLSRKWVCIDLFHRDMRFSKRGAHFLSSLHLGREGDKQTKQRRDSPRHYEESAPTTHHYGWLCALRIKFGREGRKAKTSSM
jgi:hypothetical protein